MTVIQYIAYSMLFLLELAGLASYMYWGFQLNQNVLPRWIPGLGVPLLVALLWGAFVAPKAVYPLAEPMRLILQLSVFALAAIALDHAGKRLLAILLFSTTLIVLLVIHITKKG